MISQRILVELQSVLDLDFFCIVNLGLAFVVGVFDIIGLKRRLSDCQHILIASAELIIEAPLP